ncbi:MAG TPA: sigma-70 family RNA polymerase sigma factor [Anaeromyxobacteraceae bacterium]|nr:sigma-70 family RNA polymerase sigma factor [Anaeromyxobacteraceae bacterium]
MRALVAEGHVGDAAGLAIRGLRQEVLRYLLATLRDEADADDAFSHWAEGLWRGLATFRFECSLRIWSLRLATNAAVNVRNAAWRRRVRRFRTGEASAIAAEIRGSSLFRVEREARELEALRRSLSVLDQALLGLRVDRKLSWQEIAQVLSRSGQGVSAATACKRFERLKDRLTQKAREEGLVE